MEQDLLIERHAANTDPARLVASRRVATGALVFPRVPDTSPAAPGYEPVELSPTATLYSYTVIHPNPKSGQPPFALVYADFAEGARVFGRLQLDEGERPQIGMTLDVVVESEGAEEHAAYHFAPVRETAR